MSSSSNYNHHSFVPGEMYFGTIKINCEYIEFDIDSISISQRTTEDEDYLLFYDGDIDSIEWSYNGHCVQNRGLVGHYLFINTTRNLYEPHDEFLSDGCRITIRIDNGTDFNQIMTLIHKDKSIERVEGVLRYLIATGVKGIPDVQVDTNGHSRGEIDATDVSADENGSVSTYRTERSAGGILHGSDKRLSFDDNGSTGTYRTERSAGRVLHGSCHCTSCRFKRLKRKFRYDSDLEDLKSWHPKGSRFSSLRSKLRRTN